MRHRTGDRREAHQIIEGPARQIGVDEGCIYLAGVPHGLQYRLLGDGIEHHPLHGLALQRAFFLQDFQHMPGDRFAFAVGVGGENEAVVGLEGGGDVGEALGRLAVDLP